MVVYNARAGLLNGAVPFTKWRHSIAQTMHSCLGVHVTGATMRVALMVGGLGLSHSAACGQDQQPFDVTDNMLFRLLILLSFLHT